MPPRPKYTKEEIVQAAIEIVKKSGIDAVVAREVAKELGTTTGPIFTYFDTMDELKEEVYLYAKEHCIKGLKESLKYTPAFKEFGLRWIRYAKKDPNLYMLLFMMKGIRKNGEDFINLDFLEVLTPMVGEVMQEFYVSQADAKRMICRMLIFAQGIASMLINEIADFSEEELSCMLSEMCVSFAAGCKIQDGTIDLQHTKRMYDRLGAFPEIKRKEKKQEEKIEQ